MPFPTRLLPSPLFLAAACALSLLLLAAAPARAATLLSVDFGSGGAETGFVQWSTGGDGTGIRSTTLGVYSLKLAGGVTVADLATANSQFSVNERTRPAMTDSGAFTYRDLYYDRVVGTILSGSAPAGAGLLLQLGGFDPNTEYVLQLWGYEHNNRGVEKFVNFYDLTSGSETLLGGFTTTVNQLPLDNDDFSITATVTSDAAGNIILKSRSNFDGVGIFNGVTVSSVPEPGIASLTLLGTCAIFLRRRRRHGPANV